MEQIKILNHRSRQIFTIWEAMTELKSNPFIEQVYPAQTFLLLKALETALGMHDESVGEGMTE